jgi:hypothetical protein
MFQLWEVKLSREFVMLHLLLNLVNQSEMLHNLQSLCRLNKVAA